MADHPPGLLILGIMFGRAGVHSADPGVGTPASGLGAVMLYSMVGAMCGLIVGMIIAKIVTFIYYLSGRSFRGHNLALGGMVIGGILFGCLAAFNKSIWP